MKRKKANEEQGAPLWVMTYGDLMSLLLVFFIMLFAISEIVEDERYQAITDQIREQFTGRAGGGKLPTDEDPELSVIPILEAMLREAKSMERSRATDPGPEGPEMQVTQIREGMQYIVGGRITFEPGSADLTPQGRDQLDQIVDMIRGYNNVVELRGHADANEVRDLQRHRDLSSLSFARAQALKEQLTERGIRSQRLRMVVVADNEPLAGRVYTAADRAPNRRAEVVVRESLVEDFQQPEAVR